MGDVSAEPRSPSLLHALRMRCPLCGHKPITTGYGQLVDACPSCRYAYAQGEDGYYVGALIINMAVCLISFFLAFVGTILLTWPDVPWGALTFITIGVMIAVPVLFYPRSKTVWIWLDLRIHPYAAGERPVR